MENSEKNEISWDEVEMSYFYHIMVLPG